jgi:hypothetical protein
MFGGSVFHGQVVLALLPQEEELCRTSGHA